MSIIKKVFIKSPVPFKKILVNIEAIKREYYRRWGGYNNLYKKIDKNKVFSKTALKLQEIELGELLNYSKMNIPAYKKITIAGTIDPLKQFPILTKQDLSSNAEIFFESKIKKRELYKGATSGSTGKPLRFYKEREAVRKNYIYADKMLEIIGIKTEDKKGRFSGITLFDYNKITPPYWVYINKYKQLQFSPYHLKEDNFHLYVEEMIKHEIVYGTGYAHSWLILAEYILKYNYHVPKLKAIITDSEGVSEGQQNIIEKAFGCKVYQTYGLGEVGQVAFQCEYKKYHIIPQIAVIEILDSNYQNVEAGVTGQIVITSLNSKKVPYIRYATGDLGRLGANTCKCSWEGQFLEEIIGRIDDYIITKDGRKINRLSHIMKPAKGVINSQLIQTSLDEITINIIPNSNFEENSMKEVMNNAKNYLGNVNLTWKIVDELEYTANGKIKHVIRKI